MFATTMSSSVVKTLTTVCAVGTGLVGGVCFAYSTFVMPGLRRISPSAGSVAMQSINKRAPASPLFMLALIGTAGASVALGVIAVVRWGSTSATLALAGSILALGPLVVTIAYHVPHNDAFGLIDADGPGIAEAWRRYLAGWVPWNHVRSITGLAGSVLLTLSIRAA